MTRRALLWWAVAALAVIVLGATWFMTEFVEVPTTRWEKMGQEARKNRYLALERFFARMGRPLQAVPDARRLAGMSAGGGVLLLDRERRRHLPPERAEALLGWVESGGYLIVAAERAGTEDPVLRRLGVSWHVPPPARAGGEKPAPPGKTGKAASQPATVAVHVPGSARPLALARIQGGLVAGKLQPVWRAELEPGRAQVLHYAWGKGWVTVFNDFQPFANVNIGQHDHAELLWSLASVYQPGGPAWLAARLKVPSLWAWLAGSAWMVLVSGAVLMLLWLWRIVPRFGGLHPLPAPERRGLAEHLAAVGRAVWREGGLAHWLTLVRQALLARIAHRYPHLQRLPAAERAAALARLSGISAARVHLALEGRGAVSRHAFTETVRVIQQLEQRL